MIERDLLNSVISAEDKAKEILEEAKKEVSVLWSEFEEEKKKIINDMELQLKQKVKTEKEKAESLLEEKLAEIEKEKESLLRSVEDVAKVQKNKLTEEIVNSILNKVA